MESETIGAAIAHLQSIATDISGLRRTLDAEGMSVSDRQYLSRCFDLLEMELAALREYLDGVA
jgi:RNA polymerase-interacting CarD/CdnL/TRCF family regulator